jgi:uncharacterized protein YecE (DUF72 family)
MNNTDNNIFQDPRRIERFQFRNLGPNIFLGTASDRYAGWIDQIYTRERYEGRISRRTKTVGGKSFVERTLPVESVEEYFEHFPLLEIDYTFYSPLLAEDGKPTQTFYTLKKYRQYMRQNDRVVLKVPRAISARKVYRGGKYLENKTYLNPEIFRKQFYEPAIEILGSIFNGMIFEQEYQRKQDRVPVKKLAEDFNRFFEAIPGDTRYHIELRTEAYLSSPVFEILEKHGVGQVLSHWTWLPSLRKQLTKAGGRVFNSGRQRIIRLMTPIGMRYEDAYAKGHPFDKLVEGMLQTEMVCEAANFMREAIENGVQTNILINNRAGGNAPIIAQKVAEEFFGGDGVLGNRQLDT